MEDITIRYEHFRYITRLLNDRIIDIRERVSKIRKFKTFKNKIISNFRTDDYYSYLIELRRLNNEYLMIHDIFNKKPIPLLISSESDDIISYSKDRR